jgi:hypothetical protein
LSWCVPFANLVVSSTQDMPSAIVLSVLTRVASTKNSTRLTPRPAT